MVYTMKELKKNIMSERFKNVYLTLIESVIAYGIIGWGRSYDNILSYLQLRTVCSGCSKKLEFPTK